MKKYLKLAWVIIPCLLLFFYLYKSLKSSLFFQDKDRINIVFYDKNPKLYSLGLKDNTNFYLNFYPDLELLVPGGYGYYRTGALNKLVSLEKKPDIYRKVFSLNAAFFVNYYFYPSKAEIFYGNQETVKDNFISFNTIFFSQTNSNLFDKVYLYFKLIGKDMSNFKLLDLPVEKKNDQYFYSQNLSFKNYQGFFYEKKYREERRNVQIIYNKSYKTALLLSQMIEGEGVKVVDMTESQSILQPCRITEDTDTFSETSEALAYYFHCSLIKNKTGISDIIFELGNKEKEWEVD